MSAGSRLGSERIGVVVGLAAEARIARRLGFRVEVGGGDAPGAAQAAQRLADEGATALISFGLAGGLDPTLRPGTIVVPARILCDGRSLPADPPLAARLGGASTDLLLAGKRIATTGAEKRKLHAETGAAAIDLETGGVASVAAARGLPFAVLRAICDPAERSLPRAALAALDLHGRIALLQVLRAVTREPSQIAGLIRLAADAAVARRALVQRVAAIIARRSARPPSG